MPSTADVLDQHLRCFGENDLNGVLADYASDAVLFVPDRPLKGPDAIKPFFQAFFSEFAKPGASFSVRQRHVEVTTLTFCGAQKQQTIRTKPPPTRSWCRTGRSWRSPLPRRLPRSPDQPVRHTGWCNPGLLWRVVSRKAARGGQNRYGGLAPQWETQRPDRGSTDALNSSEVD